MFIGLLELQLRDIQGNLLDFRRGKNILFDENRVSFLFNPCIVDNPTSFSIYLSNFKESLPNSYTYWDNSNILNSTIYASSAIASMITDTIDNKTNMYSLYSGSMSSGGITQTVGLVGLMYSGSLVSAITLDSPIPHPINTYLTAIYKIIIGFNNTSDLYGNVFNWINRVWTNAGSLSKQKYFTVPSNGFNTLGTNTIASLTERTNLESALSLVTIPIDSVNMISGIVKDGNPSISLFNNSFQSSMSRVFLHTNNSQSFYADLNDAEPKSVGSIDVVPSNINYCSSFCINIQASGEVYRSGYGSEYDIDVYPCSWNDIVKYTVKRFQLLNNSNNTLGGKFIIPQIYVSSNRSFYVKNTLTSTYSNYSNPPIPNSTNLIIGYDNLEYSYPINGEIIGNNGVISNNGIMFYGYSNSNVLRKFDFSQLDNKNYSEESYTFTGLTKINGYQIDDSTEQVILFALGIDGKNKIVKIDISDMSQFTVYDINSTNFVGLSNADLAAPSFTNWSWRVGNGKMVWYSNMRIHYWDGSNSVTLCPSFIISDLVDLCVNDSFDTIFFVLQRASSIWYIIRLSDWSILNSFTVAVANGGCYVDENWMYMLNNTLSFCKRVNTITYDLDTSISLYQGNTEVSNIRTSFVPNRSMIPGSLMYSIFNYYSLTGLSYSYFCLDVYPLHYGWNGDEWIHNYTGGYKPSHEDAEDFPYGTIQFTGSGSIDLVSGEYYSFSVNPTGFVFDNTMSFSTNDWVYTGQPVQATDTFILEYPHPPIPSNIPEILTKSLHPDFMCVETDSRYITVTFDDGTIGSQISTENNMSYYGEYIINSNGTITFYKTCVNHSVTVKYYWIRRT